MASLGPLGRAGSVEVGQHVSSALFQCSAESTQLGQSGRDAVADRLDDGGEFGLAGAVVRVSVGGHDALVGAPGRLDRGVLIGGEYAGESGVLAVGEQAATGAQHSADAVERITDPAAVPAGVCWTRWRHRSSASPARATT